jgi:hypothetical protein
MRLDLAPLIAIDPLAEPSQSATRRLRAAAAACHTYSWYRLNPGYGLTSREGLHMATPDIHLLANENWTTLATVNDSFVTTTLNSPRSYTISDSSTGLSLNVVGTGFTTQPFGSWNVLASGTITKFTFSLDGETFVTGSPYTLPGSVFEQTLESSLSQEDFTPLFKQWFDIPTVVSGTGPIVVGNLENLSQYNADINRIDITSGAATATIGDFESYENLLNKISAGFSISGPSTTIEPELNALEADVKHIHSIHFTNPSPAIKVTAAEDTADAGLLAKIASAYVLDVHNTDGAWTITGENKGNDLTIQDIKGVDTITGGGSGEDFVFGPKFGTATLTDFHDHLTGSAHDTVTLPDSDFGTSVPAMLHDDAKLSPSGTAVIISKGSDHLTLEDMTLSQLVSTDFKLV